MKKLLCLLIFFEIGGLGLAAYAKNHLDHQFWPLLSRVAADFEKFHELPAAPSPHLAREDLALAHDTHLWELILNKLQQETHAYWHTLHETLQRYEMKSVQYLWPQDTLPLIIGRLRCPDAFTLDPLSTQENVQLLIKALEKIFHDPDPFWGLQFQPVLFGAQNELGLNNDWATYLGQKIKEKGSSFFAWAHHFLLHCTSGDRRNLLQHPHLQQSLKQLILQNLEDDLPLLPQELDFYESWAYDREVIEALKENLKRENTNLANYFFQPPCQDWLTTNFKDGGPSFLLEKSVFGPGHN